MKFLVRMSYQDEDYDAFARLSGKTLARGRTIGMRLACVLVAALTVFFAAVIMQQGSSIGSWVLLAVAIVFACLAIFFYPYQAWMLRRQKPNDVGETTYTFKDNVFEMESNLGKREYEYSRLVKVYETEGHLFLMINEKSALVLPKRCFVSGTPRGLKSFLEEKTGQKVIALSL